MTQNQIAYQKHLEDRRHNVELEKQGRDTIAFNASHLGRMDAESQRHNYATELEAARHNYASEGLTSGSLAESIRHNAIMEGLGAYDSETKRQQAGTSQYSADTGRLQLDVTKRGQDMSLAGDALKSKYLLPAAGALAGSKIGQSVGPLLFLPKSTGAQSLAQKINPSALAQSIKRKPSSVFSVSSLASPPLKIQRVER